MLNTSANGCSRRTSDTIGYTYSYMHDSLGLPPPVYPFVRPHSPSALLASGPVADFSAHTHENMYPAHRDFPDILPPHLLSAESRLLPPTASLDSTALAAPPAPRRSNHKPAWQSSDTSRTPAVKLSPASLAKPVALCTSLPSGTTLLQCGHCDAWVGTNAGDIKDNHAFRMHQIRAGQCLHLQKCAEASARSSAHVGPSSSSATLPVAYNCPGIPLEWPSDFGDMHRTYPFHLHATDPRRGRLKWDICGKDGAIYLVRAEHCSRVLDHLGPCARCTALIQSIQLKHKSMAQVDPTSSASTVNFNHYNHEQLLQLLSVRNKKLALKDFEVSMPTLCTRHSLTAITDHSPSEALESGPAGKGGPAEPFRSAH
jgi:hypothetical protein